MVDGMESHKTHYLLRRTLSHSEKKIKETRSVFFSDAKYCGNLKEVEMEKCVYTKDANELVSSLQSQLNLLAQEMQKNSSLNTVKKSKFED